MGSDLRYNRSVFITGITGFVGSSLAERLVARGDYVVGLVRDEIAKSHFHRLGLEKKITVIRGNLEDYSLLDRTLNEYRIDVVYHLGAQAIVEIANSSPLTTFKANIEGTWNILEACRNNKKHISAVVVASSDKAYGSHKDLPYREEMPLNPEYPYDVSKACADLIAQSYFKTYDIPVVITRFGNIYGPGDLNYSRVIPSTMWSILNNRNPMIRSDGTPERDYIYIDDVIDFYVLLAEHIKEVKGGVFNAGHKSPVLVREVVEMILRLCGRTDLKPEVLGQGSLHGEIDRQWLDSAKAKRLLGWEPQVELAEGLNKTMTWFQRVFLQEGRQT